jgi:hypothetical protein
VADIQDQQMFVRNSAHIRKSGPRTPCKRAVSKLPPMDYQELKRNDNAQRASSAQRAVQSSEFSEARSRLYSAGVGMKGRLGHLKRAVADAHRNRLSSRVSETGQTSSSDQAVDIEVYSCNRCDRMFCHVEEMQRHSLSCEKLLSL